jgi:carbon monoxide dehydrogenase subunit G
MASVRREISIQARPEAVWACLRDFGAVHQRVAPGFVVDAQLDGDARLVKFANGTEAREVLVDLDDEARRLVYAVVGNARIQQHSASVQVFTDGDASRLVWIADLLPNGIAGYVAAQMDEAAITMKEALGKA